MQFRDQLDVKLSQPQRRPILNLADALLVCEGKSVQSQAAPRTAPSLSQPVPHRPPHPGRIGFSPAQGVEGGRFRTPSDGQQTTSFYVVKAIFANVQFEFLHHAIHARHSLYHQMTPS